MSFFETYATILEPFIQKYKGANEKERKGIIKNAADTVLKSRDLLEDKGIDLPKYLPTVFYSFCLY
jgi:hypothetical protein